MKKTLAILLTLILTFSCFSILGVGTVSAEIHSTGQEIIKSDFKADYEKGSTNWVSTLPNSNHVEIKNEADEYFARVSNSGKSHGGMYSTPFEIVPNNEYEFSFYFRIPTQTREGGYDFGATNYQPAFGLFEVTTNADKTAVIPKVPGVDNNANNTLYAYSGSEVKRRTTFETNWTIELPNNTVEFQTTNSTINYMGPDKYKNIVNEKDATEVYADWTKFTVKFKGLADEANEKSQTAAFAFNFLNLGNAELFFDIKDVSLVCTDNGTVSKTIMTSDFDNSDGTNWQNTQNSVTYGDDNGDGVNDYARVTHTASSGKGLFSTPFNLVPGNEYELTYYVRVPEGSDSYDMSGTFFAPTTAFYQPKVNDAGIKVTNTAQAATTESGNNYYAYSYTNKDDPTLNWVRRSGFSATWTIDGYESKTKPNFSSFGYIDHGSVLSGANADLNEAFADWTKVTVNFTAIANTEDEKTQVAAVAFVFENYKGDKNLVFDIKDVTLTETKSKINPEPEAPDAVFTEGFEDMTQEELEAFITNRTWSKPTLVTSDAATGTKCAAIRAYYEYLFIPVDKSILDAGTFYEFSMDWKLKVPTLEKKSYIDTVGFVGYNPSQGETIKKDAVTIEYKNNLYGTGNWENVNVRFRVTDLNAYEQFGILIRYIGSEPYDNTDTIYIDTLMIAPSENQNIKTEIDLYEEERTDDTIKVLAFGNSFSVDAAVYIDDIAKADGKDIRVGNSVIGGCSIEKHYKKMKSGDADYDFSFYSIATEKSQHFGNVSMQQILAATDWDYIVIQQASQDSGIIDTYEPYLTDVLAYFKQKCPNAEIRFHATWAYSQDSTHSGFVNYDNDQTTMHEAIEDAYLVASQNHGFVPIIPTGEAIRRARASVMGDNFDRDGYHLNDKGRMIAALVWYETFTGISALDAKVDLTKLTGSIGDTGGIPGGFVSEEESVIMRTAAHEASALFKLANETHKAIDAIGEVTAESGEAIAKAEELRAELNDDDLIINLQTLLDAIATYEELTTPDEVVGDLDGDGIVELKDVTKLAQALAGWNEVDKSVLDFNNDDVVNLKDLIILARFVAGWEGVTLG